MTDKPDVLVLATGGTIANPRDVDGYLSGRKLIDGVPEVEAVANVEVKDVTSTGSTGITFEDWWRLHDEIMEAATREDPPDGIVVTHGSNTVEETAYFLHLTVPTATPVVLTAAQRNHRLVGNDGDRNLLDAVLVAGTETARGRGSMVVVNDEIHSARDVTKTASGRPDAWSSGNRGVLGLVDKHDNVRFVRDIEQRRAPNTEFDIGGVEPEEFPQVDIVYSAVGMDGSMIESAVENGADGIVLAAHPTGSLAKTGQAETAERVHAEGTPVVRSHRGKDGWPNTSKSGIWGNTLTPQKARVLLGLALLETDDYGEIQRMFEEY